MNLTLDQSKDEIAKLCQYFETNRKSFFAPGVKEAHVRQSLIDPFFENLGWDVRNSSRIAPQYREVVPEDSLDVEGHQKAPDYTFRVGQTPKFYAEAKKCGVNINVDLGPAYQLRRYAYSAKLDLSILTDFEEFSVYECSSRPKPSDKASHSRIHYFCFEEYPDRWKEIWDMFSREAVWAGSFDQYISSKKKRGTSEVDTEFLKDIENWRETLARNIALRNPSLGVVDLNTAVQRTIDRIIFLRIAEDRGLEPYQQLLKLCEQPNIYRRFISNLCRKADEKYNSGLFHFQKESGVSDLPDIVTPNLVIDDKVLKPIIQGLYFEFGSPYHFGVLPVEILGTVYERFLGKVIRLTAGHQAKVEEKPEVRKAGGVYYTPSYIVDYIVKNTVGKQIEGKSPAQIAKGKDGQPIRILDMACGSGSFLLGAYQYLLDHCQKWYEANDPEKHAKAVFQDNKGIWRLSISERKRILTTHIYGVDIDRQAVEVTKLSLLIKALEGENDATLTQQMQLFQERALPNLTNNIKCGNSLIGPDYFSGTLFPGPEELNRINPFDWKSEFSEVMKTGGFDCVIGNPPYVDIKALLMQDVRYIFSYFPTANNRINLFASFIEKSLMVAKRKSFHFSYIIPTALFTQDSYRTLRKFILDNFYIGSIVRIPNESFGNVSGEVKVDTAIIVLSNPILGEALTEIISYMGYSRISRIDSSTAHMHSYLHQSAWKASKDYVWSIATSTFDDSILMKCDQNSAPMEDCVEFCLGLTPYDKYKGHTPFQIKNRVFHADFQQDETFRRLLAGNDIMRYHVEWSGKEWISYGPWLGASREKKFFNKKRILVKQIIDWTSKRIWASITDEELYNTQNAFNLLAKQGWPLEYILGILNSKLMTFYHRKKYLDEFKMRFQKILIKDCRRFPIRLINPKVMPSDKTRQDNIIKLVEQMLSLQKHRPMLQSTAEQKKAQRLIDSTDKQIDALIYELYNLAQEEIEVVEAAVK